MYIRNTYTAHVGRRVSRQRGAGRLAMANIDDFGLPIYSAYAEHDGEHTRSRALSRTETQAHTVPTSTHTHTHAAPSLNPANQHTQRHLRGAQFMASL